MNLKRDFLIATKDTAILLSVAFAAHVIPESLGWIDIAGEAVSFISGALAIGEAGVAIIHGADYLRGYQPKNQL